MNQPNVPPGYGPPNYNQQPPQGQPASYPQHPQQAYAQQAWQQPHGIRGMTRQMFNPASYRQQGSASWGVASLIVSLVSAILCFGMVAPISLLLGFVGMIGKKRAKGMALAGVLISLVQMVLWGAVIGLGVHLVYWAEEYAGQAGAPVVAAISEFKTDNGRVPHSLDELVENGYLPPTWTNGLDSLDKDVRAAVEGAKWTDFLRYKPGGDATWTGDTGFIEAMSSGSAEDFAELVGIPANTEGKEFQQYGLAFVGVDKQWSTSDDKAVAQTGGYDLQNLFGGGTEKTREITRKRRELQSMLKNLESKTAYYETALSKAEKDLAEAESDLRAEARKRNLNTLEEVKADKVANEHLQLIGETQKRLLIVRKKQRDAGDTFAQLKVKVRRLANQEEMSKLADSPEELAALDRLLEESRSALDEKSGLGELDSLSERAAADQWFKENFK